MKTIIILTWLLAIVIFAYGQVAFGKTIVVPGCFAWNTWQGIAHQPNHPRCYSI